MKPNRTTPERAACALFCSSPDPVADELRRYDDHLRDVRGLAAGTRRNHCRIVGQLLQKKFAGGVVTIGRLHAADVRRFIARQLGDSPSHSAAAQVATALRSYLRYRTDLRRLGCGSDRGHFLAGAVEACIVATRPQAGRSSTAARRTPLRAQAPARLCHRPLRTGHGAACWRDREPVDRRHRLARRHGHAEGHEVATTGHPATADDHRTSLGGLPAA
jgi:hypothetical protein